jgi:vancomycin resistance protein YoaR
MRPVKPLVALAILTALAVVKAASADPARDEPASFPVELGSFSTTLLGSLPARTHNIRLAAAALDSMVLEPGAELSFNDRVGPRTADRGYLVAPVILREERQAQLGGGICQVASTMFDAALVAGLTPTERCRHSSPVDYIALGEDATIAWGYKDLKLRNDLAQAVRMRVEVLGATLLVRIEGEAEEERRYELVTEERDVPASTDANLPGHEVELYRIHLVDGREIERELVHRDLYPSARIKSR